MSRIDYKSMIGRAFGSWTVRSMHLADRRVRFDVVCACGTEADVDAHSVVSGRSKRCNACSLSFRGPRDGHGATAGRKTTPEWNSWRAMIERCSNPKHVTWLRYGGRGITVCERWTSFENFLADMGPRPTRRHSLDRIDGDGNYEPGNCRWATASEQARNRRSARLLTIGGETLCLDDWAKRSGLPVSTIHDRIRRGWSPERAVQPRTKNRDIS
jgi:hypothetical protein